MSVFQGSGPETVHSKIKFNQHLTERIQMILCMIFYQQRVKMTYKIMIQKGQLEFLNFSTFCIGHRLQ